MQEDLTADSSPPPLQDAHVPRSSAPDFVKSFLEHQVGSSKSHETLLDKLRYQTVLLDPSHKHPKPSQPSRPRRLSSREKKKLKLHEIPPEQQNYEDFLPLHHLWLGYMEEVLQLKTDAGLNRLATPRLS